MTVNNLGNLSQMTGLSQAELAKKAEALVDAKTGKISALAALEAALVDAATAGKANMESFTAAGSASANPHTIDEPLHEYTHGVPMDGFAPEPPAPPSIGGPAALLERAAKLGAGRVSGFCGGCYPPPPPAPPPPVSPEAPAAPPPSSPESGNNAGGEVVLGPTPSSVESQTAPPPAPTAPTAPTTSAPPPQSVAPTAPAPTSPTSPSVVLAPPTAPAAPNKTRAFSSTVPAPSARKGGFVQATSTPGTAKSGAAAGSAGPSGSLDVSAAAAQGDLDANSRNIQFELLKQQVQKMSEMQNLMSNVLSAMHEQGMTAIRNVKA